MLGLWAECVEYILVRRWCGCFGNRDHRGEIQWYT